MEREFENPQEEIKPESGKTEQPEEKGNCSEKEEDIEGREGKKSRVLHSGEAYALLEVDDKDKLVWIERIESDECGRGTGHGSALLDKIKIEYPGYVICGNMVPLDVIGLEKPNDEELNEAYDLGWDPKTGKIYNVGLVLNNEQIAFINDVAKRYYASKIDPFGRLRSFYKKNKFNFPEEEGAGGYFESKPPHTLRKKPLK